MPQSKHGSSTISMVWLKEEFDKLHHEHALILKKLEGSTPKFVTPELRAQVLITSKMGTKIDEKVPDKNVPPIP